MIISSGIYTKSIPSQTGCLLGFAVPRNCYTGNVIEFGLSGTTLESVSIISGKIYDSSGRNIYSINFEEDILYNLYVSSGEVFNIINNKIISKTYNTGKFSYAYVKTNFTINTNLKLSGEYPNLVINQLNNFSGVNKVITGSIVNNTPLVDFEITEVNIKNNTGNYSIKTFTTGRISSSGLFEIEATSGIVLNKQIIPIEIFTNFKTLNFDIDSNPENELTLNQYLELYPGSNVIFDTSNSKDFNLVSYFNSGASTRNLEIRLDYISGCNYAPVTNYYSFSGSGYLSGIITGGYGELTGLVSGYYTGNSGTLISGYYENYVFTGNYTGTKTTTGTGLFSGNNVTGLISSGYNANLTSGHSGKIVLGSGTGLITGSLEFLSGTHAINFSFGTSGSTENFYITGYSGSTSNLISGNRSYIYDSSGINFYLCVYGLNLIDLPNIEFDIAKLKHYPTGFSGTYYESFDEFSFSRISYSNNFSGIKSGSYCVYTGTIPSGGVSGSSDQISVESMFGPNVSGGYSVYIGVQTNSQYPSGIWYIDQFSLLNLPVSSKSNYSITGTGFYSPVYITGNVNILKNIEMNTGILEFPGKANFYDVWNLKTGLYNTNYIDFKLNNLYTTGTFFNSGNYGICNKDQANSFYINIQHDGEGLSGYNLAKLKFNDGIISGEVTITGKSEIT